MASVVGEGTLAELDGWFKRRYGKYVPLVPINSVLQDVIPFSESDSDGENFNEPIGLQLEHGVTYAPTNAGAFTLDPPIAAKKKNAQVTGVQHVLRSALDYEVVVKAAKSERAFGRATKQSFMDMKESIHKRLEIDLWYGQDELATCGTVVTGANGTITPQIAEWAPGIWSGMEGAKCEIFDSAGTTKRGGTHTITEIDLDLRRIKFDSVDANVVSTDRVFFKTQRTTSAHNTMMGLHTILSTTSGNIFGIPTQTYSLWRATSRSAGSGPLTFAKIQLLVAQMVGKGLDSNVICCVNPKAWADLLTEQAAFRQYPTEKVRWDNGSEALRFHSQNGYVDIKASFYVKEGYAYVFSPSEWKRVGATDLTFRLPDMGFVGGVSEFFRPLADNAGVEWRCYSHQALYSAKIGRSGIMTSIVNTL
ncbi:MAG TPA: hypothetical protein VFU34_05045 [Gaiellaceae bacterium]|nr:hypothetical protein [Gaiellaceae bacterium]